MKPLLLIGCGGHARSLIDLIETQGEWHIHGLIGLPEQVGSTVLSYPVIGTDDDLATCEEDGVIGTVAGIVGNIQANEAIKYILDVGKCLNGKVLIINLLNLEFRICDLI